MKVSVKLDLKALGDVVGVANKALVLTGHSLLSDLKRSQTMPRDSGDLQNILTGINSDDAEKSVVYIASQGPYARRNYFHPEYNFQKGHNANAGADWFAPYLPGGSKSGMAKKRFAEHYKKLSGGGS